MSQVTHTHKKKLHDFEKTKYSFIILKINNEAQIFRLT